MKEKIKNIIENLISFGLLAPFVIGMIIYGSTKPTPAGGRIEFDTQYVLNTGSYLTNDVCHIALLRSSDVIPLDSAVLVFARPLASTNAADWVQLLPQRTIADHIPNGCDYALANATNYHVTVSADFIPPTPEVTNKLLRASALVANGWLPILPENPLPFVVPGAGLETSASTSPNERTHP